MTNSDRSSGDVCKTHQRTARPPGLVALALSLLLAVCTGAASAQSSSCAQAVGRDFPTASLASKNMSPAPLVDVLRRLDDQQLDVRAFLLLKDCTLVFERYKDGIGRDHSHSIYSVTKSVVSTLVGVLRREGKLPDIERPISTIMPRPPGLQDAQWERASTLSLRNAMNMASGLAHVNNASVHPIYDLKIDRFGYALSQAAPNKPGTTFNYSNADASITGAVVAGVAGQEMYAYAKRNLLDPLETVNHDWWFRDAAGRPPGGWGLRMRPMDMLKLGQLYLQKGTWNGKRIFDEDYLQLAWSAGPAPDYGLYWWIRKEIAGKPVEYYAAIGYKGQRIYIFPRHGVVAALVASVPPDEEKALTAMLLPAIVEAAAAPPFFNRVRDVKEAELAGLARAGFHGVTRVRQSAQDTPSPP